MERRDKRPRRTNTFSFLQRWLALPCQRPFHPGSFFFAERRWMDGWMGTSKLEGAVDLLRRNGLVRRLILTSGKSQPFLSLPFAFHHAFSLRRSFKNLRTDFDHGLLSPSFQLAGLPILRRSLQPRQSPIPFDVRDGEGPLLLLPLPLARLDLPLLLLHRRTQTRRLSSRTLRYPSLHQKARRQGQAHEELHSEHRRNGEESWDEV